MKISMMALLGCGLCFGLLSTAVAIEKVAVDENTLFSRPAQDVTQLTMLVREGAANALLEQYQLTMVYRDSGTGVLVVDASAHEDMQQLLTSLRGHDEVKAVRLARIDRPHQLPTPREGIRERIRQ